MPEPLITVSLAMHDGDVKYAKRAFDSLEKQDLDPGLFEVAIAYDGEPSPESYELLTEATRGRPFSIGLYHTSEKTGYYTVPRNYALPWGGCGVHSNAPYIVNMDADNEFTPVHLRGLLNMIRTQHPQRGWPHFAYTRRLYVRDEGANEKLPEGPSDLVPFTKENAIRLTISPQSNFIDTGDFIIGRGSMYELAERTGFVWNPDCRRFGDWDLMSRLIRCGFFGVALDQVSHIYHWTGNNLQTSRWLDDVIALPLPVYEELKRKGQIIHDPEKN